MAFRPNYRQQRNDRDRSTRSKQDEKLKKLMERAEKRKAEREGTPLAETDAVTPVADGERS